MTNQRGYVLMMFSWSVLALSLYAQMFMTRSVTDLRVTEWYKTEAESKQIAEGGLDSMINFFMNTTDLSCIAYEKPNFSSPGSCVEPYAGNCTCETALSQQVAEVTTGNLGFRNAIAANNPNDVVFQVKVSNSGPTKTVRVKGFRDFTSAAPRAIAEVGAELTLSQQISQGLIGIESVRIGADGNVEGDVATLSSALDAIQLDRRAWVRGRIMIGELPAEIDPDDFGSWVGYRNDRHRIVMGHESATMDQDPIAMTLAQRQASITSQGHEYHVIDDTKKTIADKAHVVHGIVPSAELQQVIDELTQSPEVITAGMDCTSNVDLGQFEIQTITVSHPAYNATKNAFCFNSIEMLRNAQLIFNVPGTVKVYIKGEIPGWSGEALRVGDGATIKKQTGATPVYDGVQIKLASSNQIEFFNDAVLYGSIFAPQSYLHFNHFNDINGNTVLANVLFIKTMANQGIPGGGGTASAVFRVDGLRYWIERPNPEAD